jgi:CubicO group peptidase (beta-lactamase class C family)
MFDKHLHKRINVFFNVLVIFLISFVGCKRNQEPEISIVPLARNDGWEISSPEAQGMSSEILLKAYEKAAERNYMYSLLVVRNGLLLAENYFNGATAGQAKYIASATKSFLSALIGIALREELLSNINQTMMTFFPEYDTGNIEAAKFNITIKQLLQMRAGYWHDSEDNRWQAWVSSPDWVEYMINLPLENSPDTAWNYSSGSSHLLCAILTKVSGKSAEDFARQYLFEPLEIDLAHWGQDPQGINYGGFDMHITPRDMARFGLLYLNGGNYKGQQIVPGPWIEESTAAYSDVHWEYGVIRVPQYGYHWWVGKTGEERIFFATGHGGQNIVVIPDLNMVVVTTTNPNLSFTASWTQSLRVFALIVNDVLKAVID